MRKMFKATLLSLMGKYEKSCMYQLKLTSLSLKLQDSNNYGGKHAPN